MDRKPDPIRLKVVAAPFQHRIVLIQVDPEIPVFRGSDFDEPDRRCGQCGNLLITHVMTRPHGSQAISFIVQQTVGLHRVSGILVPQKAYLHFKGSAAIACGSCGSVNELASTDV